MIQIPPLVEVFAFGSKDLNPIVLTISDKNPAIRVNPDCVWGSELSRPLTRSAPGASQLSFRRKPVNRGVSVTVRDVNVAVRRDRHVGWGVERRLKARAMPL